MACCCPLDKCQLVLLAPLRMEPLRSEQRGSCCKGQDRSRYTQSSTSVALACPSAPGGVYAILCKQLTVEWRASGLQGTNGGEAFQFGAARDAQTAADTSQLSGNVSTGAATFSFIQVPRCTHAALY